MSPLTYGHDAIVLNEFLDNRWSAVRLEIEIKDPGVGETTFAKVLLESIGVPTEEYWFWVCIGTLFSFSILFNILFVGALTYLNCELHLLGFFFLMFFVTKMMLPINKTPYLYGKSKYQLWESPKLSFQMKRVTKEK